MISGYADEKQGYTGPLIELSDTYDII